jgi:hypothetical protein
MVQCNSLLTELKAVQIANATNVSFTGSDSAEITATVVRWAGAGREGARQGD